MIYNWQQIPLNQEQLHNHIGKVILICIVLISTKNIQGLRKYKNKEKFDKQEDYLIEQATVSGFPIINQINYYNER